MTAPAPFSIGARGAIKSEAGHEVWLFMDSLAVVPKHLWQSDIDPTWLAQWGYFITVEHETALSGSANQIMLGGELLNKETWLSRPSRFRSPSWGSKWPQPLVPWLVGKTTAQLVELTNDYCETQATRKAARGELDDRLKSVWRASRKDKASPWPVAWPNKWLTPEAFDIPAFDAAWLKADAAWRLSHRTHHYHHYDARSLKK